MIYIRKYIDRIISFIYPTRCPYCNKIISFDEPYCKTCESVFPLACRLRTLNTTSEKDILCLSVFNYHSKVKYYIWKFKFKGQREFDKAFASKMADAIYENKAFNKKIDFITSVPLTFSKYVKRGYNQSVLLGKELSYITKIPYKKLLKKTKDNKAQHELPKEQRKTNVKGVYSSTNQKHIAGKTILLCDDIVTTGSTLSECAKMLYSCGASQVFCITIADASKELELIEKIC